MSMQQFAALLQASFSPEQSARRAAEKAIDALQDGASFGTDALSLTQDAHQPRTIRQAAALVFKNWVKTSWDVVRRRRDDDEGLSGRRTRARTPSRRRTASRSRRTSCRS